MAQKTTKHVLNISLTWHHWTHSQTFHAYPNKIPTIHRFPALILYYKSKELCHGQWISPSSIEAQIWPQLTHFMTGFFVLKWRSTSYVFVELQKKRFHLRSMRWEQNNLSELFQALAVQLLSQQFSQSNAIGIVLACVQGRNRFHESKMTWIGVILSLVKACICGVIPAYLWRSHHKGSQMLPQRRYSKLRVVWYIMCLRFSLFLIFPTVFHVLKDPQIIYIFGIGTHQVLVDLHWQPTNDDSIPGASKSVVSKMKTREFLHLFREAFSRSMFHSIFVSLSMWHTKEKPKWLWV